MPDDTCGAGKTERNTTPELASPRSPPRYMWATASSRAKDLRASTPCLELQSRRSREPEPSHDPVAPETHGESAQTGQNRAEDTGEEEEQQLEEDLKAGNLASQLSRQLSEKYKMNISVDVSPGQSAQARNLTAPGSCLRAQPTTPAASRLGEPASRGQSCGAHQPLRRELWSPGRGNASRDETAASALVDREGGSRAERAAASRVADEQAAQAHKLDATPATCAREANASAGLHRNVAPAAATAFAVQAGTGATLRHPSAAYAQAVRLQEARSEASALVVAVRAGIQQNAAAAHIAAEDMPGAAARALRADAGLAGAANAGAQSSESAQDQKGASAGGAAQPSVCTTWPPAPDPAAPRPGHRGDESRGAPEDVRPAASRADERAAALQEVGQAAPAVQHAVRPAAGDSHEGVPEEPSGAVHDGRAGEQGQDTSAPGEGTEFAEILERLKALQAQHAADAAASRQRHVGASISTDDAPARRRLLTRDRLGRRVEFLPPFVTLTYAQSLDGSITAADGSPTSISGRGSMLMTHHLRAHHDAILVGSGTVLKDDPSLTVRLCEGRNPQPVVLDSSLSCPLSSRLVTSPLCQRPIIAYTRAACNRRGGVTLQASQTVDGEGRRHDARLDRTRHVPPGDSPKPLNPWQSVLNSLGKALGRTGEKEPRHGSHTRGGPSGWQSGEDAEDGELGTRPLLSHSAELRKAALEAAGCRPLLCRSQGQLRASPATEQGADAARVDMLSLLYELSCLGIRSLMVEGGAQVIRSFLSCGLPNYLVITIAPIMLGGLSAVSPQATPRQGGDMAGAKRAPALPLLRSERYYTVGRDLVASFLPQSVLCTATSSQSRSSDSGPLPRVDAARAAAAKDAQAPAAVLPAAPLALAPGDAGVWTKHWDDESRRSYYHNHKSKESTWEPPAGFLASARADYTAFAAFADGADERKAEESKGAGWDGTHSDWSAREHEATSSASFSSSSEASSSSSAGDAQPPAAMPSLTPWAAMAMGYTEYLPRQDQTQRGSLQGANTRPQDQNAENVEPPTNAEWQEFCSQDGSRYLYNSITQEAWREYLTDDGQEYYYNLKTTETTWDRPGV